MTGHDRERILELEYQRDVAKRHRCPLVAAARQREIDKIMAKYKTDSDNEKETD